MNSQKLQFGIAVFLVSIAFPLLFFIGISFNAGTAEGVPTETVNERTSVSEKEISWVENTKVLAGREMVL